MRKHSGLAKFLHNRSEMQSVDLKTNFFWMEMKVYLRPFQAGMLPVTG